jgi:hypothetical protein
MDKLGALSENDAMLELDNLETDDPDFPEECLAVVDVACRVGDESSSASSSSSSKTAQQFQRQLPTQALQGSPEWDQPHPQSYVPPAQQQQQQEPELARQQ